LTPIEVFSTCPPSGGFPGDGYVRHVIDVARWSDEAECRGILVYADNSQVDPWLVSQIIVQNTKTLCPLVAVQPVYTHPYTVAKLVTSLAQSRNFAKVRSKALLHGTRLNTHFIPSQTGSAPSCP